MKDKKLLKFSRQIILPEIGIEGQEKLFNSHALIIGLGGLGSPAGLYLVASGIGEITLVDSDNVELSNLQRQILYEINDIGEEKTKSAKEKLKKINPDCKINIFQEKFKKDNLVAQIKNCDIVLDCSDNFSTRFLLNSFCKLYNTPLVSGAALEWTGQLMTFSYENSTACYRCIFHDDGKENLSCADNGIISPLVGIIGSMQALEAIKILCGIGNTLKNKLSIYYGLNAKWKTIELVADPNCPVCGNEK